MASHSEYKHETLARLKEAKLDSYDERKLARHYTDAEQRERARDRTDFVEGLLQGKDRGATKEIEQYCLETEEILRERARETGSRPLTHAAEVVEAHRLLVKDKDLGDRFLRITRRLEELRLEKDDAQAEQLRQEIANLRPLLRLSIRSSEFRTVMQSLVRIARHVVEAKGKQNGNLKDKARDLKEHSSKHEIAKEKTKYKEHSSKHEIAKEKTKYKEHQDLYTRDTTLNSHLSDKEWNKISAELDTVFETLSGHSDLRKGVKQLFRLAELLPTRLKEGVNVSHREPGRRREKAVGMMDPEEKRRMKRERKLEKERRYMEHRDHMAKLRSSGSSSAAQHNIAALQRETRDLVAQFSGERDLNKFLYSLDSLMRKMRHNESARAWWARFRDHTLRVMKDYDGRKDLDEYRTIFNDGRRLIGKHQWRIEKLLDRAKRVIDNISNDQFVEHLRERIAVLYDDLYWTDAEGNRYYDRDAASAIGSSIVQVIKEEFKYLALPRISRTEPNGTSYSIENVVLMGELPDRIDFHIESDAMLNIASLGNNMGSKILLTASIKGIFLEARDIHFSYKSKRFSEAGVMQKLTIHRADVLLDFVMRPSRSDISGQRYEFVRTRSHVNISDLTIVYDKNTLSHRFLVPRATNMFKRTIINRLEKGIEVSLNKSLLSVGESVTMLLNRMPNPLSVSNFKSVPGVGNFVGADPQRKI